MFSDEFLDKLLGVGVSCVVVTAGWENGHNFRTTINRIIDAHSILGGGRMCYGETVEDILEAHKSQKLAVVLQFQNTSPIEHDVRLLEVWYKLGVRVMELTYSQRNLVGDGCDENTDYGLSKFGQSVVQEMNRIGLVVDLSHTSYATSMEAMQLSKDPIIFSHSNVKALADYSNPLWPRRRNLADDQIKAMADKDGVMGIAAQSFLIKNDWEKKPPVVKDMVDHIEYVINLVGANHVGIGLDYTEGNGPPENAINSVADVVEITYDLMNRGYSKTEIKKIMGENFLRVFRRVWKNY